MPTLDWVGKSAVVSHDKQIPYRLIHCDGGLSIGDAGEGNLLVEGDNLEALKALLPYYASKVKCIYIDPPYNTGNEGWVYNDNLSAPEIRSWLGKVVGDKTEDFSRHDKWMCMMYPRLNLLHQLLRDDGVIFVSIDSNENHNLRLLMNEIFGEHNFVAELVWEKTRKNDAKLFSVGHEYLLVFARSLNTLREQNTVWREAKPGAAEIMQQYRRLRRIHGSNDETVEKMLQKWYQDLPKNHPSRKLSRYKHIDQRGPWRDRDISWPGGGGPRYAVLHPITNQPCAVPERGWGFSTPDTMQKQIELGLIAFREDHRQPPFRKAHLVPVIEGMDDAIPDEDDGDEQEPAGLQVMSSVIYKQSQVAVKHFRKLMGADVFNNPKDHEVVARLIRYCTSPTGNDLVLDSFGGSGTTGHSVMQLNAEDGGNRRFILIEMESNICRNITAERLRRVIQGQEAVVPGPGADIAEQASRAELYAIENVADRGAATLYEVSVSGASVRSGGSNGSLPFQEEELAATQTPNAPGLGGGFRYCTLGVPLFDKDGKICPEVLFSDLAHHIHFTETGEPLPQRAKDQTPHIGTTNGIAYYLLWGGAEEECVLDMAALRTLPPHDGPKIVYADGCCLPAERLKQAGIIFKQVPYEVKVR